MSLLNALLLDPYPFEVWIAKRTDGIYGSGIDSTSPTTRLTVGGARI